MYSIFFADVYIFPDYPMRNVLFLRLHNTHNTQLTPPFYSRRLKTVHWSAHFSCYRATVKLLNVLKFFIVLSSYNFKVFIVFVNISDYLDCYFFNLNLDFVFNFNFFYLILFEMAQAQLDSTKVSTYI